MKNALRELTGTRMCLLGFALSTCSLGTAQAATIIESATAPTVNILASQLTAVGPGDFDGTRLYADNGGPPGQTFMVYSPALLESITVLGRGDSAGSWVDGPQPFTGAEVWSVWVSRVNPDGSLTQLSSETATGFAAPANLSTYLTFDLNTPVALNPDESYAFNIGINAGWYGFAHGGNGNDAYIEGYGFNNNTSIDNPGGNASPRNTFNGWAAPIPANIDFVFAIQGTIVPEPASAALLGLGALGLIFARQRRA